MDKYTALLVIENVPVLAAVLVGVIFSRFSGSFLPGVIIGLIFGLAAFVGMELYGMEYVNDALGGGGGFGGGSSGGV